MQNLALFFYPISERFVLSLDPSDWGAQIGVNALQWPDLSNVDVVLFGVEDARGSLTDKGSKFAPDVIREKLYRLKKSQSAIRVADLGNLKVGETNRDTYFVLKEVCEMIMNQGMLPIILGGSQDLDFGQFMSYEGLGRLINVVNVDAVFDIDDQQGVVNDQTHIREIIIHKPNYLFDYTHIGYQSYLVNQAVLNTFEKLNFEGIRLGEVRENIKEVEPSIRYADMVTFDVTSIRKSDAPSNSKAVPFGLTGEEACQLAWYIGMGDRLSSFGIYGFNPEIGDADQTSFVVAVMVWYFVEGHYNKSDDMDFSSDNYIRYVVSFHDTPGRMTFLKSSKSGKWWLRLNDDHIEDFSIQNIIPCSYSDYEKACRGEIPDRWIAGNSKLF